MKILSDNLRGRLRELPHQDLLENIAGRLRGGHLVTIVGSDGRVRTTTDNQVTLAPGEIAVVFCLPIFGAPTRRLRDVDLSRNQFARIRCGLSTLDIFCGRVTGGTPAQTRTLSPGEFVVVTCDR